MKKAGVATGYTKNGLPYMRIEGGAQTLVIFGGLSFNHKPPSGLEQRWTYRTYRPLLRRFTVYSIGRKPGLPPGYTIRDMSEDYAAMIKEEMRIPVYLIGISTGGAIALQFAADHAELVCRLVLASAGCRLSLSGAEIQRKIANLVQQNRWRSAAAAMGSGMSSGRMKPVFTVMCWLWGKGFFGSPHDPSDGLVELDAEDRFNFKKRLAEIKIPTLVIGGEEDAFYPIRETAKGITAAKLVLFKGAGHDAMMSEHQFNQEILAFLSRSIA